MRGSGGGCDSLLKGYVKQEADHKGNIAEYGVLPSHLQEQKDVQEREKFLNEQ